MSHGTARHAHPQLVSMTSLLSLFRAFGSHASMKTSGLLVFVIGATGTGKSKLAIEVATKLKGEVINADSLQLYTGLDIVTNKVTEEEQNSIKHHLLGFADPLVPLTVIDFKKRALPIISNLLAKNITPVIAGGSMYYIEALLWNVLLEDGSETDECLFEEDRKLEQHVTELDEPLTAENVYDQPVLASSFRDTPSPELHAILQKLDPEAADVVHLNDKRKIIRCLQVIQRHNAKYSQIIDKQRSQVGGSHLGGSLRYTNVVILWTQSDEAVLNKRLDDRVDEMLERGLVQELDHFHKDYNVRREAHGLKAEYTQGIFQAIGLKEFHDYLLLPREKRPDRLLQQCIARMKTRTRLYARKQLKWINNRMICATDRQIPPLFSVDTTNPSEWDAVVRDRAFQILNHQRAGHAFPPHLQPLPRQERPKALENRKGLLVCDVCQRTFQGTLHYEAHMKSKRHRDATRNQSES